LEFASVAASSCSGTGFSPLEFAWVAASSCLGTGLSPWEFAWVAASSCSGIAELLESITPTDGALSACFVRTLSEGIRDNTSDFVSISTHRFLTQSLEILTFLSWHAQKKFSPVMQQHH
jgi:hypothetical protein